MTSTFHIPIERTATRHKEPRWPNIALLILVSGWLGFFIFRHLYR